MCSARVTAASVGWSKPKRDLDALLELTPWRVHDIRRSVATGMAELGVQPHIVEAALNHVSGHKAGVAGVYNRAVYAAEKRTALELWTNQVLTLTGEVPDAGLVVVFPASARKYTGGSAN